MINTPVFADGVLGVLAMTNNTGDRITLMKWRYYIPEQKKSMHNYSVAPQSITNVCQPYMQISGGWDTANPPHKSPFQFTYGNTVVIYAGITSTCGFLGTFKVTSEEHGHSLEDGADFGFTCDQQGAITRTPA